MPNRTSMSTVDTDAADAAATAAGAAFESTSLSLMPAENSLRLVHRASAVLAQTSVKVHPLVREKLRVLRIGANALALPRRVRGRAQVGAQARAQLPREQRLQLTTPQADKRVELDALGHENLDDVVWPRDAVHQHRLLRHLALACDGAQLGLHFEHHVLQYQ